MRFRRGIVIVDMVIGTALVVIIGGLLAYTVSELNVTTRRLEHSRNELRRQQAMLYKAMAGQRSLGGVGGGHLRVLRLRSADKAGSVPTGYQWAFVASKSKYGFGRRLYALVPRSKRSVKTGGRHR